MTNPIRSTRRRAIALAAGLGAALLAGGALAQNNYPNKPITLMVAYPAGGDTDAIARLLAEKLSARVGQPVLVDNRPGASGTIGTGHVAKAAPDGYTLLLAPSTFSIAPLVLKAGTPAYDVLNGLTPIVQIGTQPMLVTVSATTGIKSIKELVAKAKAAPMTYASPGSGSPMQVMGAMFNKAAGVDIAHVPYRGAAPAVNDLLGGHVPVSYMTLGPVAPHVAAGKVTLLAVADSKRSSLAPDVPTLEEQGIRGVEISAWQGVFGPKGLPAEIVNTLNAHFNEIIRMPDVAARIAVFGAQPAGGPPSVLAEVNARDYERFGKVIKEFGIQAD